MIFAKKRFFYAEISVRMSSARDSPAIAGFASSEAASARLSDVDLMLRGRHVWRLLSGIRFPALRFFFSAEFATAFLFPNTTFRCGQIFSGRRFFSLSGIRGVFRVYFLRLADSAMF